MPPRDRSPSALLKKITRPAKTLKEATRKNDELLQAIEKEQDPALKRQYQKEATIERNNLQELSKHHPFVQNALLRESVDDAVKSADETAAMYKQLSDESKRARTQAKAQQVQAMIDNRQESPYYRAPPKSRAPIKFEEKALTPGSMSRAMGKSASSAFSPTGEVSDTRSSVTASGHRRTATETFGGGPVVAATAPGYDNRQSLDERSASSHASSYGSSPSRISHQARPERFSKEAFGVPPAIEVTRSSDTSHSDRSSYSAPRGPGLPYQSAIGYPSSFNVDNSSDAFASTPEVNMAGNPVRIRQTAISSTSNLPSASWQHASAPYFEAHPRGPAHPPSSGFSHVEQAPRGRQTLAPPGQAPAGGPYMGGYSAAPGYSGHPAAPQAPYSAPQPPHTSKGSSSKHSGSSKHGGGRR
ncbi:hypothetical protein EV715DRAFT_286712 [Schizophyllum commune]